MIMRQRAISNDRLLIRNKCCLKRIDDFQCKVVEKIFILFIFAWMCSENRNVLLTMTYYVDRWYYIARH